MRPVRSPIAALMGAVLVFALGLAALRIASPAWAGTTVLVTCGVLCLAIVGVICCTGGERAWWLGFALFGWGWLLQAFWSPFELPTADQVRALELRLQPPAQDADDIVRFTLVAGSSAGSPGHGRAATPFARICLCLLALVSAYLGATLAGMLFSRPTERDDNRDTRARVEQGTHRPRWLSAVALVALAACALFVVPAFFASPSSPDFWAAAMFYATWGLLGVVVVGAVTAHGRHRHVLVGAALFGIGYMILAVGRARDAENWPRLPTEHLLERLRPSFPPGISGYPSSSPGLAAANARVMESLKKKGYFSLAAETPLNDFLKYLHQLTVGRGGGGVPIYVDPVDLVEAGKTINFTVSNIELEDVPLKTGLQLALDQLGLSYHIRDGCVRITSAQSAITPVYVDQFLIGGHCVLALLAAGLGASVAAVFPGLLDRPATNDNMGRGRFPRSPDEGPIDAHHSLSDRSADGGGGCRRAGPGGAA